MKTKKYYFINGITLYRLIAAPVLVLLVFGEHINWFKWLLTISFFTDLIDGFLARKFKTTSVFGSRLDSIADDLTILSAIVGMFVLKMDFIRENAGFVIILLSLFIFQIFIAFIKYRKLTSFHTYLAKAAALLQGTFFILIFFLPEPVYALFYTATAVTVLDLLEEIILVLYLPVWRSNVRGLYWVLKNRRRNELPHQMDSGRVEPPIC